MAEHARRTRHDASDPELLCQAAELVIQAQFPSPSMLQRRLWIGYATAAKVLDRLEQAGVVGPAAGIRQRDVLVTPDQLPDVLAKLRGEVAASEPRTPSDVLDAAVAHIHQYGWIRDEYVETNANPRTCRVCPRGAIAIANNRHPLYAVDWPELAEHYTGDDDDAGTLTVEGDAELADLRLIVEAERLLVAYLKSEGVDVGDLPPWDVGTFIERWADDPERTLPQILGAMTAAAQMGRVS